MSLAGAAERADQGYHPGTVEISVLGPIEVAGPDGLLQVGGPKERVVLAVLAAHAGEVVSGERLVDALWGDRPPRSAGKLVQNLVLRLRKALGRDLIETRPGGYLLRVAPEALDAARFERLVSEGREDVARGELAAAVASFTSALRLWRGRPLEELVDWPAARVEATRLEELHACAEEDWRTRRWGWAVIGTGRRSSRPW